MHSNLYFFISLPDSKKESINIVVPISIRIGRSSPGEGEGNVLHLLYARQRRLNGGRDIISANIAVFRYNMRVIPDAAHIEIWTGILY